MVSYQLINRKHQEGEEIGLKISGHASEYGKTNGGNIVCAAVSTVCDMVFRGCVNYTNTFEYEVASGKFDFICRKLPETSAIIHAGILELDKIKENYPKCFKKKG